MVRKGYKEVFLVSMKRKVWNENENVIINPRFSEKNNPYIELIPFNREITPRYAVSIVKKLLKKYDNFVLYSDDLVFDGLSETNAMLLRDGFNVRDKYTGKNIYVTLKAKKKTKEVC